jgi:hypothetical protein
MDENRGREVEKASKRNFTHLPSSSSESGTIAVVFRHTARNRINIACCALHPLKTATAFCLSVKHHAPT